MKCEARPLFEREAWREHPHYPRQLMLLGSHENFRRISNILIAKTSGRSGDRTLPDHRRILGGLRCPDLHAPLPTRQGRRRIHLCAVTLV